MRGRGQIEERALFGGLRLHSTGTVSLQRHIGSRISRERLQSAAYSMTSSAVMISDWGIVMPMDLAVLTLTPSSKRLGAWTGRLPANSPESMRPTYAAARLN